MSLAELLPEVRALARGDKFRLIQLLADELEKAERAEIVPGQDYPVWSPTEAFAAADAMLRTLGLPSEVK